MGFERTEPEELRRAARVSLWVRWLALVLCLLKVNYRVKYGALGLSPEYSGTPPS